MRNFTPENAMLSRERARFSKEASLASIEREKLLQEIARTKSKSTRSMKEKEFTIEAQGKMLDQLRRELEMSERMSRESEIKRKELIEEREAARRNVADANARLKELEEKTTDASQNSRAISIAHERVFALSNDLKEKNEEVMKVEAQNKILQKEVQERKRVLGDPNAVRIGPRLRTRVTRERGKDHARNNIGNETDRRGKKEKNRGVTRLGRVFRESGTGKRRVEGDGASTRR